MADYTNVDVYMTGDPMQPYSYDDVDVDTMGACLRVIDSGESLVVTTLFPIVNVERVVLIEPKEDDEDA